MAQASFDILRSSDMELVLALRRLAADKAFSFPTITFRYLTEGEFQVAPSALDTDERLNSLLAEDVRVFSSVLLKCDTAVITIRRHASNSANKDNPAPFDEVTVSTDRPNTDPKQLSALFAFAQRHLGKFRISALWTYLGEDAKRHFQARDTALARLEEMVANSTRRLEDGRREMDARLVAKETQLEEKYAQKQESLEAAFRDKDARLEKRKAELEERERTLNLLEPRTERRRVFEDMKSTLDLWGKTFKVSEETERKRKPTFLLLAGLLGTCALGTALFLFLGVRAVDTASLIVDYARATVFLLLTVSFGIYFARWTNSWAQRHAEEEFRLKRMLLDLHRAHWFVELAFQWHDVHKETLPAELISRLTSHLFSWPQEDSDESSFESIATALLGASAKVRISPAGAEVEIDKKGVKELKKN